MPPTLFSSKGAPSALLLGPYFETKEAPGPPRGAFFETHVSISEACSHQGPFFGAPWGRKGRVGDPGAPTSTEKPNYSNYSNPKTALSLKREHRFQRSQGSQTKQMRGSDSGGGVNVEMEAPVQPPMSTRPADKQIKH